MDPSKNSLRYQPKVYGVSNEQGYGSSFRLRVPVHNAMYPRAVDQYIKNEVEDVEDEEIEGEMEKINGVRMIGKDSYDDDEEEEEEEEDLDADEDVDDVSDDNSDDGERYYGNVEGSRIGRPQKKRKLQNLISKYEFAPRVRVPPVQEAVPSLSSSGGRNSVASWTEHETFALLDAWGDRFLGLGRKSLRSEEWQEVADRVSQETNVDRTEAQCRNRLDTLKKKYRKEKMRSVNGGGGVSKWVFYRKMDMLLGSTTPQPVSLSCGMDSGEFVFMNSKVYLNRANGLDEMRDSPGNSESSADAVDDSDELPSKGKRAKGRTVDSSKYQVLADSIQKFSDIYENIEFDKRKQIVELESMRMDFQRQLETQRRQILERAQAQIVKIRHGSDNDNDLSAENQCG